MTKLLRWPCLVLLALAAALPARAQETGLNFLRIGANAAASAMGDAQVAASRDAFSTYWNPAGLAAAPANTAAVSHRIWVGDFRTYDVAARFRAGATGGLGLAVTAADSGDLDARETPGLPDGTFSAQFVSLGVSYGRRFGPVRAGVTAKYLTERIFESTATGYAFDAGVQADVLGGDVLLGAAVQNLGRMTKLENKRSPLPRTLRAGLAVVPFHLLAASDGSVLAAVTLAAEAAHLFDGDATRLHAGAAADLLDLITLRAGLITNDALRDLTFGGGLHYGALVFDYAFLPFETGFEGPGHVLTLAYTW